MAFSLVDTLDFLRVFALFVLLIGAAYTDLLYGKVYNAFTYTGLAIGILVSLAIGDLETGTRPLGDALLGCGLGFGMFFVAHLYGGVGLGDVKLMAAVGALTGWHFVLAATFFSALAGAALSLIILAQRKRLLEGLRTAGALLLSPRKMRKKTRADGTPALTGITIPFGFATAIGALIAWFRYPQFL